MTTEQRSGGVEAEPGFMQGKFFMQYVYNVWCGTWFRKGYNNQVTRNLAHRVVALTKDIDSSSISTLRYGTLGR